MYGKIIKEIRKERGMKQKEVYGNVVSKSFYSDFEAEKSSIEASKFLAILDNLGLSYHEFECYKDKSDKNLAKEVDGLYKQGKFDELYSFYEEHHTDSEANVRFLAVKSYLLVLITNTNFYKLSREPFKEIVYEIENYKSWNLREISLAKLVLLSISERDKSKADIIFQRIKTELKKYKVLDDKVYYEELADLFFNRIQSLLIINDIEDAKSVWGQYKQIVNQSDNLHLLIQYQFINNLVGMYLDFPVFQNKMSIFLENLNQTNSSEFNFYKIIFGIHKEKAKNYFSRYINLT